MFIGCFQLHSNGHRSFNTFSSLRLSTSYKKCITFEIVFVKDSVLSCLWLRQWRNRQGAQCPPPRDFWPGNFCWPTGEREVRKKGKMEQKIRKIKKGRWKIENGRRSYKTRRGPFFYFILFYFSLFKKTEICFGSTKMGVFYQGKKHFTRGKK